MVKLVVAYGTPEDPDAFDRYYADTHIPLVNKIPNLRRFESGKVVGNARRLRAAVLLPRRAVVRGRR